MKNIIIYTVIPALIFSGTLVGSFWLCTYVAGWWGFFGAGAFWFAILCIVNEDPRW